MTDKTSAELNQLLDSKQLDSLLQQTEPFIQLMMKYRCAMREVQTKFEVLNEEFSSKHKRNPVESIKTRLKNPQSIIEKLNRKHYPVSLESVEKNISDIAGIRVICSFIEDIYAMAQMLTRQDDITLVEARDYIRSPKPNGYRSLHLIVEVPIFLSETKEYMKVEVQIRTIAMDFWASLEHKVRYKKNIENPKAIEERLKRCADDIAALDLEMQEISKQIELH